MNKLGCLLALVLLASAAGAQGVNPHVTESIGTVEQVYDGALFSDIQVNTFRNIDRLYPTRTVKRGDTFSTMLPVAKAKCEIVAHRSFDDRSGR